MYLNPKHSHKIAFFPADRMFSMKWHDVNLPEAQVLVLNFEADNYVLPEFVKKMRTLKVLIVTNYGSSPVELSNFQLLDSLSHLKRIRLERISVASIIINNRIQLESLRKISLFMCSIGEAFRNCPLFISEAFPNLEEMNIDFCNDLVEMPDELCSLIHLKSLCITNCHKLSALPEEIGKLFNLEVLRLRSCRGLNKLPGSFKNLEKLILLDISGCICIEELHFGEMSSLKKINVEQCSGLQILPSSTNLEQLEEVICDEDKKALWETVLPSSKIRVLKQEGKLETDSEILIES